MKIAGNLYTARDIDKTKTYPALIVGAPYGGVKEQAPCVYANELAQRGFVVLTFDQSFMGDSGGTPRKVHHLISSLKTSVRRWTILDCCHM